MSFDRPYEGLRVVDMSQGVAGPYCGMLLVVPWAKGFNGDPFKRDKRIRKADQ